MKFYSVTLHFDRYVWEIMITGDCLYAVKEAIRNGESVDVVSHNWVDRKPLTERFILRGDSVNYMSFKETPDSPW